MRVSAYFLAANPLYSGKQSDGHFNRDIPNDFIVILLSLESQSLLEMHIQGNMPRNTPGSRPQSSSTTHTPFCGQPPCPSPPPSLQENRAIWVVLQYQGTSVLGNVVSSSKETLDINSLKTRLASNHSDLESLRSVCFCLSPLLFTGSSQLAYSPCFLCTTRILAPPSPLSLGQTERVPGGMDD